MRGPWERRAAIVDEPQSGNGRALRRPAGSGHNPRLMPRPALPARLLTARRAPYLFIAPFFAVFAVFVAAPLGVSLWLSFRGAENGFQPIELLEWVGADNYFRALGDSGLQQVWMVTLQLTLVASLLIHAAALPLAWWLHRRLRRVRACVTALYFLPYLTMPMMVVPMFLLLFGTKFGPVNQALAALAGWDLGGFSPLGWLLPNLPIDWDRGDPAFWRMALVMVWRFLGWNVLLYLGALQMINREVFEAAEVDGITPWQQFRHVALPLVQPMALFAVAMTALTLMQVFEEPMLMDFPALNVAVYYQLFGSGDIGYASGMGWLMLLYMLPLLWLIAHAWRRSSLSAGGGAAGAGGGAGAAPAGSAPPALPAGERLDGLDGLRAIACLAVVFHHLFQRLDGDKQPLWLDGLRNFFLKGEVGVCLFFVLSGALLSMPFWQAFVAGRQPPSLRTYAWRRAARIVPGYYTALLLSVPLTLAAMPDAPHVWGRLAAGLGFVSGYHYISFFPSEFNPVLWSISLEVSCYLLLPLLLWGLWRRPAAAPRDSAREPARRGMLWLLGAMAALQLLHGLSIVLLMTDEAGKGWEYGIIGGAKQWLPYWGVAGFMTQFLMGSAAALAIAWRQRQVAAQAVPPRDGLYDVVALVAASLCVSLVMARLWPGAPDPATLQPYLSPWLPGLLAIVLFCASQGRRVHRWLDNPLMRFLAKISFGLYLWHWAVMEVVRLHVPRYHYAGIADAQQWWQLSLTVLLAGVALAWLSYTFVEAPALRWARRVEARWGTAGAAQPEQSSR
jgi:peptidoglycan/LPS O-acetylase OafA/YrhL/ABC-type sugar transport system permease subunit